MKRNAVIGLAAALTITVGAGAGLAGYAIAHNKNVATVQAMQEKEEVKDVIQTVEVETAKAELTAQKEETAKVRDEKNKALVNAAAQKAANTSLVTKEKKEAEQKAAAEKKAAEEKAAREAAEKKAAEEKAAREAAEKKAAEEKAAREAAEKKANERIVSLAGNYEHPETVETGMMCGDCVDNITDLMGGTTLGNEEALTADAPVLYMLNEDGSSVVTEKYGTVEAGVKYFTKLVIHSNNTAVGDTLKLNDKLEGWHIASIDGHTVTLYSPVFITE